MIYPEGARNGSENLPVRPLFSGTAKMAMETDTPIVCVFIGLIANWNEENGKSKQWVTALAVGIRRN